MKRMPTRKLIRRFYRPWWRRPFTWMLLLVPAAIGARIALTPWLTSEAREALSRVPGHDVRFERLGVSLFPPRIAVRHLEVRGADSTRLLTAERVDVEIPWRELTKRERRVNVTIAAPRYLAATDAGLDLAALVAPLPRARIDLLVVHDGRVEVPNSAGGATPLLLDVDAQAKDLATHGQGGAPRVEGTAGLLRSGQLHFSFDLVKGAPSGLPGRGALDLRGLALGDLESLVGRTPAQAWGALEASARLAARGPALEGRLSARTSLSQTGAEPQALASALEAGLSRLAPGVALQVTEGQPDERGVAVTGTVAPPGLGFVDAALGLVRATLVRSVELGLRPGLDAPAPQDAVAVE